MSDWMSNLPEQLQRIKLNNLAIPGSHNSGAYNLSSILSPDAPSFLKPLCKVPGVMRIIQHWCECQRISFKDQLNSGIRYLDLRISSKRNSDDLYLVHALYGPKIQPTLEEIKQFVDLHTGEVVIIDFNHFYAMNSHHHQQLIDLVKSTFGSKLLERRPIDDALNLEWLRENKKQVICFYQHNEGAGDAYTWTKEFIWAPWPNTKSPNTCLRKLTRYMQDVSTSSRNCFMVCQGILTPDVTYTLSPRNRGGVHRLTQRFRPSFLSWLKDSPSNWSHLPNIVIHDFVDEDNYIQCVLDLNDCRITADKT